MSATSTVTPVTPVVKPEEKLQEVKVTIVPDKEEAIIVNVNAVKIMGLAFGLQKHGENPYDNESQFRKDALELASLNFLKAECSKTIARWDNLVSKATKLPRYAKNNRAEIEKSLSDNPRSKPIYAAMLKAAEIKKQIA